jgi:hypothetical protein
MFLPSRLTGYAAAVDQIVHPVEGAQQGRLAKPDGLITLGRYTLLGIFTTSN